MHKRKNKGGPGPGLTIYIGTPYVYKTLTKLPLEEAKEARKLNIRDKHWRSTNCLAVLIQNGINIEPWDWSVFIDQHPDITEQCVNLIEELNDKNKWPFFDKNQKDLCHLIAVARYLATYKDKAEKYKRRW